MEFLAILLVVGIIEFFYNKYQKTKSLNEKYNNSVKFNSSYEYMAYNSIQSNIEEGVNAKFMKQLLDEKNNLIENRKKTKKIDAQINTFGTLMPDYLKDKYSHLEKEFTNSLGMKFVRIRQGIFSTDGRDYNSNYSYSFISNSVKVKISKPFYMAIYPVTQEIWESVMGRAPGNKRRIPFCNEKFTVLDTTRENYGEIAWDAWKNFAGYANPSICIGPKHPVEGISYEFAQEFIRRLNKLEHHDCYRLPTSMEWELAARAETKSKFYIEESDLLTKYFAWDTTEASFTHPVGQKLPNPYGLYDMFGNVFEWTMDFESNFVEEGYLEDYKGPAIGSRHEVRGGGNLGCHFCLLDTDPINRYLFKGFRVIFAPKDIKQVKDTITKESLPSEVNFDFLDKLLDEDGNYLGAIPISLITKDLCDRAIYNDTDPYNYYSISPFKYVPEKFKDESYCEEAISVSPNAIYSMPSKEILKHIDEWNKICIAFFDYKYLNEDVVIKCIEINNININNLPKKFKNLNFYIKCFSSVDIPFKIIDDDQKNDELYLAYVSMARNGYKVIRYLPDYCLNKDFFRRCLNINRNLYEHVPERFRPVLESSQKRQRIQPVPNPIRSIVRARRIEFLLHFTKNSNLQSIIRSGLIPRDELGTLDPFYDVNDNQRIDNRTNTVSLSIGFPNYKMFYKYRKLDDGSSTGWSVIGLDSAILYEKKCLFCFSNAASNAIRFMDDDELCTAESLDRMFSDEYGNRDGLPSWMPTDPQAEVLVCEIIPPRYIKFIHFENLGDCDKFKDSARIPMECNQNYFSSRDFYLNRQNSL